MTRVLGVDVGSRRLGLALGDPETGMAVPVDTIELGEVCAYDVLMEIIARDGYDFVVFGAPEATSVASADLRRQVEELARDVHASAGVPTTIIDEHLTSKIADQLSRESGGALHDDALAAMLIVEEFLHMTI